MHSHRCQCSYLSLGGNIRKLLNNSFIRIIV